MPIKPTSRTTAVYDLVVPYNKTLYTALDGWSGALRVFVHNDRAKMTIIPMQGRIHDFVKLELEGIMTCKDGRLRNPPSERWTLADPVKYPLTAEMLEWASGSG